MSVEVVEDLREIARVLNRDMGTYCLTEVLDLIEGTEVCPAAKDEAREIARDIYSRPECKDYMLTFSVVVPIQTRIFLLTHEERALVAV